MWLSATLSHTFERMGKREISAADIAFIMSSSTSAWILSPLEHSPQKQNGWTLRFRFWGWIMWKMYNRTIIKFGFRMISWIIKTSCLCYPPQPSVSADNTDLGFDNSWYHTQPHPIIVYLYPICHSRSSLSYRKKGQLAKLVREKRLVFSC